MGYYHSDPTAAAALGNISKERKALERKARALLRLLEEGRISPAALKQACAPFKGIHAHVLEDVREEQRKKRERNYSST